MGRKLTVLVLALTLLALVPSGARAELNSPGTFTITDMDGSIDTVGCGVGPTTTGTCSGSVYFYATNYPPEQIGAPHCIADAAYPLGSGWESWSGSQSCDLQNGTRSGEGYDPSMYLARGSTPCQGFNLNFGGGDSGVYFYLVPNIVGGNTGQKVKVGPITSGHFWTEAPPVGAPGQNDVYPRFFGDLSGVARSPSGDTYTVSIHLEGQAEGAGYCLGGSYSLWYFHVTGTGHF
jgi:hypothetical protein